MTQLHTPIVFNPTESKIQEALTHFCSHYNKDKPPQDHLELRITGGWVRDKLLGRESHDLDIAINVLSGEDFATQFLQFASDEGYDLGLNSTDIHTIKKNPEKSKHLETCTTKIYGLDIDFVNLRNEQYTEDSRVPIIECGTAEEDALRRDATLNALFYNVNKNKIEDLTCRGLSDLQAGLLRTPLQPLQTFLDDPLRVLRLIRFAAQFNFTIEPETLHAMTNLELKSALIHKISRERVGVELEKTLKSDNVPYGLRLINYVGLTPILFDSGTLRETIMKINEAKVVDDLRFQEAMVDRRIDEATQLFQLFRNFVYRDDSFGRIAYQILENSNTRKQFWLFVALQPYKGINVKISEKKKIELSYTEVVIKEGLRFGKSDYDLVAKLTKSTSDEFLHSHFKCPNETTRSELGSFIREFGDTFELSLVGNAFIDIIESTTVTEHIQTSPTFDGNIFYISEEAMDNVVKNYTALLSLIETLSLQEVRELKPLVDGKIISKTLQRKPGPWMRSVVDEVILWQLDHPEGTQETCLEHIKQFLKDK